MSTMFYALKVNKVIKETDKSKSVYFEIPNDLVDQFKYKAGQYLTLKFDINGKSERRAYSICTSPTEDVCAVTSKRVVGGIVSNYINDNIEVGDTIDVMPPEGKFTVKTDALKIRDFYFFAGGSGITPMMSLIKTILEEESKSVCNLLYANTDEENIIFKEEIDSLQKRFAGQLNVKHILDQPKQSKEGGITGLFKKAKPTWLGWTGYPDQDKINLFFSEFAPKGDDQQYYICGPTKMMEMVESNLQSLDIDKKKVMIEYFGSPQDQGETSAAAGAVSSGKRIVKATLTGNVIEVEIPDGKTILDSLIDAGYDPPFSCTSGACSTCAAKVTKGEVTMDACYALDDDEVADGHILTCQAHPTTDVVELIFEE